MGEKRKEPWEMTYVDWLEATPFETVRVGGKKTYMVKGHTVFEDVGRKTRVWSYNPETGLLEWRTITGELITKTPPPALRKVLEETKTHKQLVEQALKEGKPVPSEVLEEYPDLAEKYGKVEGEEEGKKGKISEKKLMELIEREGKLAELIEKKERLERELAEEEKEKKEVKSEKVIKLPLGVERILNLIKELQKRGKTGRMFAGVLMEKLAEEIIEEIEEEASKKVIYIVADETGRVYLKTSDKAEAGYKASMLSMEYPEKIFTIYRRVSPDAPLEKLERWKNARPETIVPFRSW